MTLILPTLAPQHVALVRATDRAASLVDTESNGLLRDLRAIFPDTPSPVGHAHLHRQIDALVGGFAHRLIASIRQHVSRVASRVHRIEAVALLDAMPERALRALAHRAALHHGARVVVMQESLLGDLLSKSLRVVRRGLLATVFALPVVPAITRWADRIVRAARLYSPASAAAAAALAIQHGQAADDATAVVAAHVRTVATIAKHEARHEAVRISTEVRKLLVKPLGNAVIGWQVHGILDTRIRPAHRDRHLDRFFIHPRTERGEKGMDECPNPPYESPAMGGILAHNCRCWLSPIIDPERIA